MIWVWIFLKDFVFFNGGSIIHLVLYTFKWECVWIVGDDEIFTDRVPLLSPLIPSVCATCIVFYRARLTDFFVSFYFILFYFYSCLNWFDLNLMGCVYLCDFAGQEKWGIRYHICGCGRLKILKSNIKGELRLNFLSRSRQAWF